LCKTFKEAILFFGLTLPDVTILPVWQLINAFLAAWKKEKRQAFYASGQKLLI
jgi:hypothetical protein